MENVNLIIAKNIYEYRKKNKLTQSELAEKLNFSDKSVSKWEKGESIPDVGVLVKMCEIFEITLNDLVSDNKPKTPKKEAQKNKLLISILAGGLVWLIATTVFAFLLILAPNLSHKWLSFVYAVPVSFVVLLVFSCIWGNNILKFLTSTVVIWTILLAICLSISNVWYLCLIGIPVQILTILWFILMRKK